MRPSRGMGAVRASKMPGGKMITRKDNPGKVTAFGKGGKVGESDKDDTSKYKITNPVGRAVMAPVMGVADTMTKVGSRAGVLTDRQGRKITPAEERDIRETRKKNLGYAKGGKVKESDEDDKTQDKALIKKAFKQHETAEHGGKHVELKLKKGGNANFIKGAIKKPGALRASLGAKKGETIPAGKLAAAANKPGKLGQRARFAEMLKGFKKK